jgi:peptide/nickel transport system substrate-binding protein
MKRSQSLISGLALLLACASPAAAENVLRYTSLSGGAVTMDPHSLWTNANRAATTQVYEALLDIDSKLAIVPQLALAWKPLGATTWEFALRPDVRFS